MHPKRKQGRGTPFLRLNLRRIPLPQYPLKEDEEAQVQDPKGQETQQGAISKGNRPWDEGEKGSNDPSDEANSRPCISATKVASNT